MKPLRVGSLDPDENKETEIDRDFRELRRTAEKMVFCLSSQSNKQYRMVCIFERKTYKKRI